MKNLIKHILKVFLFWILLFFVQRTIFLLFQLNQLSEIKFFEIILCNWHALPLDISTVCYIMFLPTLLLFFKENKFIKSTILYYYFSIIIISSIINIVDIGLFSAWGSKINSKAQSFLIYPKEVYASIKSSPILLLISVFILQIITGIIIFRKYTYISFYFKMPFYKKIISTFILLALLFIGIRGGFQTFPINKGRSYFSRHNVLNLAAVNSNWNLMRLVFAPDKFNTNTYKYLPDEKASNIIKELQTPLKDTTISILKTTRPNIVLIMLESWSADIIEPLGGEKDVAPEFSKLCKEGLLFTNFYSTGFRTEQGLAALVSGFPSQPLTSIIRTFGKFEKLPSIARVLGENGYISSYYYGGDLRFANTDSYLGTSGFDRLIGEDDFDFTKETLWGAFDEELFDFNVQDMKNIKEPFFSIIMTSTSHEPFDAPVTEKFKGNDLPNSYRNTIHYTDECLGEYINKAKQQDWYKNTLFIIVSDHSHKLPLNREINEPNRYRIPFLLYGDVLKDEYKGSNYSVIGSQVDFPATILSQLNLKHNDFTWSKNLFNKYESSSAFYTFDEGFGWINENQIIVFDHKFNQVVLKTNNNIKDKENEEYLNQGKAYLQVLFQQYIDL